MVELLTAI
ncbi:hypothetical protein D033_4791A, partial [Vibrio parahaemolyticus B-265]